MAQLASQHQPEAASWPLQLDGHLNGIKETFERLSQELDLTRRERDEYKAQLDAQAKEFADLCKFVGRRSLPGDANTFENDEQTEFTATLAPDIPAQANPIMHVFESPGSPLDDSNNKATSEELLDMKRVYTLHGYVRYVRFSPNGKYLGTIYSDGATKIYETETGKNVYVLLDWYLADKYTHVEEGVDLSCVCFSPDNRYLATAGIDDKIRIWEIGKKGIRNIFKCDIMYPGSLDFLSNGRFIVSDSRDSNVRLWNMRTGIPTIFKGSMDPIWSVRSSPEGRYIAAGTTNRVLIWAIRSSALVNCSLEHPGFVDGVDFSQDRMSLVTGSSKGTLKLWDISSLMLAQQQGLRGQQQGAIFGGVQCLRNFVDAGQVRSVAFSHDGRWVLSGSNEHVYFWDTCNGKRHHIVQVPQYSVFSLVGGYMAVGTSDNQVMVWIYRMI